MAQLLPLGWGPVGIGELFYQQDRVLCLKMGNCLPLIGSQHFIVTCRFHGVIFTHLLNKPVLALSHHLKVTLLTDDLGLSRYCFDIHTCDAASLTKAFRSLVQNGSEIKSRMNEKSAHYKGGLSLQFDDLFGKVARL